MNTLIFFIFFCLVTASILVSVKAAILVYETNKTRSPSQKADLNRRDEALAYYSLIKKRVQAILFIFITLASILFLYLDPPQSPAEFKKRMFLAFLAFVIALLFSQSLRSFKKTWRK